MGSRTEETFAEWDDERYSTGIERFDEQHKRLFGLLNDLHTAMNEGHSEERIGDILRELERYTEYHFGDEEEFMQDCGYAMDCADCFFDHREMHETFAERVSEFREKHENGEYVTMEVLMFARDWLDSHIAAGDEDQNYSQYYDEEVGEDYEYSPGQLNRNRRADDDAGSDDHGAAVEDLDVTLGSEVHAGGDLDVPDGPMAAWFESVADTHGDRTAALVPDDGGHAERTFAEFFERARAVAGGLLSTALAPGDRLAIRVASGYEWSVVDVACHLAGLVSVPVYPTFDDEQAVAVVEEANADGIVCEVGTDVEVEEAAGTVVLAEELPTDDARALPGYEAADDDVATVVYDLADAEPAGRALTHRNLLAAVAMLSDGLSLGPGATGTCFLPLPHIYQRVVTYYLWATGNAVAYMGTDDLADRLAAVQPELLVGVPKVYQQLYGALQDRIGNLGWMKRKVAGRVTAYGRDVVEGRGTPLKYSAAERLVYGPLREEFGLANVEHALSGMGSLDDHLLHFFRGFGVPVSEVYGTVESAGVGTLNPATAFERGSVGTPMAGVEVARSEAGEVLLRGPNVMSGYLADERATAYALREGWLHTGDEGHLDADGHLYLDAE